MTTQQHVQLDAVPDGRDDDIGGAPLTVLFQASAAAISGGAAAGPRPLGATVGPEPGWPAWASGQLRVAVDVAARVPAGQSIAAALYREWFNPAVGGIELFRARRPLAGVYRSAHAANDVQASGGIDVVQRHDVIGVDGWWRTWGKAWTPPRSRPGSMRMLMTPRADRRADFVRTLTAALANSPSSWSLACATDPRRARRYAAAVLDVPGNAVLPDGLLAELVPTLHPVAPPLCLQITPGVAVAAFPDNGMSFGEHRCHLIALGLRRGGRDPLDSIADVFLAHGLDPARPHGLWGRELSGACR